MRNTRPNREGYFLFSAEGVGSYEEAFDAIVREVRAAEDKYDLTFIGGPSWKQAEDQKSHFVCTQAANLVLKEAKAVPTKGAKDGKGK
jgi:hypothetical protein